MFESDIVANAAVEPIAVGVPLAAGESARRSPQLRLVKPAVSHGLRLAVHDELAPLEADWKAFEKAAECTVFQTFDWLAKWQRHVGRRQGVRPAIVTARDAGGRLLLVLPLAIETRGAIRRLTWLGRDLCDYTAPLLSPEFLRRVDGAAFLRLWRDILARIRETSPLRFDLIDLDKMPERIGASANPFAALDVQPHPCGAHIATLGDDWNRFYASKRSSATRKKERKKLKQLAEFGEVRLVDAEEGPDRAGVLEVLIEQKSRSFARMGIGNIFLRPGNRDFFMDVATDPGMREIVHVSRLDVGSLAVATSVGLRFGNCYSLVLSSYLDGDLARFGPGRVHLNELLRYAIARGFSWFDFTVGDEPYKRDWSDKEVRLYDHLAPVTLRGRAAVAAIFAYRRTKRFIKRTPMLWHAYTAARSLKGRWRGCGAKQAAEAE